MSWTLIISKFVKGLRLPYNSDQLVKGFVHIHGGILGTGFNICYLRTHDTHPKHQYDNLRIRIIISTKFHFSCLELECIECIIQKQDRSINCFWCFKVYKTNMNTLIVILKIHMLEVRYASRIIKLLNHWHAHL